MARGSSHFRNTATPPEAGDAGALFHWHLTDVKRAKKFRKPTGHPQPVWFRPFGFVSIRVIRG